LKLESRRRTLREPDTIRRCHQRISTVVTFTHVSGPNGIRGLGWHALRRKFASELKDVPLRDLCELGGWKDPQTILKCYQQPDERTMRAALANRRPL
jgi:hypothetical protein